jgi:molybdenum cofactor cytidylyltransferase
LAAGGSRRLGRPKQLERYGAASLLRHCAAAARASRCAPVSVVLGAHADACALELAGLDLLVVRNERWQEGASTSIRAGLAAVREHAPAAAGLIIALADQPLVTAAVFDRLAALSGTTGAAIVACEYSGSVGPPAFFARSIFPELELLRGDRGAKQIILADPARTVRLPLPEGACDVDTEEDVARCRSLPSA